MDQVWSFRSVSIYPRGTNIPLPSAALASSAAAWALALASMSSKTCAHCRMYRVWCGRCHWIRRKTLGPGPMTTTLHIHTPRSRSDGRRLETDRRKTHGPWSSVQAPASCAQWPCPPPPPRRRCGRPPGSSAAVCGITVWWLGFDLVIIHTTGNAHACTKIRTYIGDDA